MKRLFIVYVFLLAVFSAMAEDEKLRIAVFDPDSKGTSIDEGTKTAVRELISSTLVNTGKYEIVERSLLEKVMQEQQFSQSGAVDDSQITEIGKLAGANKVIVSVVTLVGNRNMLSVKMIDVKTASVDRQKVKVVTSGELLDVVEPLTLELVDETVTEKQTTTTTLSADTIPVAGKNELVLYLPPYKELNNEKHADHVITVFLDKQLIGSGTLGEGFSIKLPHPGGGEHKLKFGAEKLGEVTQFKINTKDRNNFEFRIRKWKYMGVTMYSVILK